MRSRKVLIHIHDIIQYVSQTTNRAPNEISDELARPSKHTLSKTSGVSELVQDPPEGLMQVGARIDVS